MSYSIGFRFYEGVIDSFDPEKRKHKVRYHLWNLMFFVTMACMHFSAYVCVTYTYTSMYIYIYIYTYLYIFIGL